MALSRRAVLSRSALAAGLFAPGRLLAAVEAATPAAARMDDWTSVRRQFRLTPEYLHFAGFFIVSHPAPVRDAIDTWRKTIDENPYLVIDGGLFESEEKDLQSRVREEIARYLGGKPDEVALTQNTTSGLALVYHGLPLGPGDEILGTTHDHQVHHQSQELSVMRSGASIRRIALFEDSARATEDEIVGRIRAALKPATRVLGVTWVHSQSGIRLPIRSIAALVREVNARREAKDRIVLVVDGVHGLGCVDETVAELNADFFAAGTHKWMFAPRGTGLVWAKAEAWARLRPVLPSFSDEESYRAWLDGRAPRTPNNARRMTPGGFQAYEHQFATIAAFRMHQQLGRKRIADRVTELNGLLKQGLAETKGVTLHTPRDPRLSAGINCFSVSGRKPEEVVAGLLGRKVIASTSPYANPKARLSAGIFNTPDEVERALSALRAAIA